MSKKTEALKLALEALAEWKEVFPDNWDAFDEQAITAIREALAEQPAQQQEPVAWRYKPKGDGGWGWSFIDLKPVDVVNYTMEPLYTSPQPSKPWVGLTEKEKRDVRNSVSYSPLAMTMGEWTEAVQNATEAKLREKNS